MRDEQTSTELPAFLHRYFWEYDAGELDWERSRSTIVFRLLESGGMDAAIWLRSRMSDEELRDFIERRHGRGIDPVGA